RVIERARGQMRGEHAKGIGAIKIIRVDRSKRLANHLCGHEDRLTGAPGLFPICRDGKSGRQFVEFLKDVFDRQTLFKPRTDGFAEGALDIMADHKDQLSKTSADGVEDGVVNDGFAAGADRIDLFEAAVTAAHAGSENKQSGFAHYI